LKSAALVAGSILRATGGATTSNWIACASRWWTGRGLTRRRFYVSADRMKIKIYPRNEVGCESLYVEFSKAPYSYSRDLDDDRQIDYAADGRPIGVSFLYIQNGVLLDGVPYRETLSPLLARYNIRELVS
jgi:hypothetical protein